MPKKWGGGGLSRGAYSYCPNVGVLPTPGISAQNRINRTVQYMHTNFTIEFLRRNDAIVT